jgi:four helix bundle protein
MNKKPPHNTTPGLIPAHGGYRELKSFQHAELVYDATVKFCERFIDKRSRTHDQMVQAARSGRQNIAEGSQASGTSKKFELKLVGVARASLEELLLDYEDFLRQRGLVLWGKDHPTAQVVRRLAYEKNRSYLTYKPMSRARRPRLRPTPSSVLSTKPITFWTNNSGSLKRLFYRRADLLNGCTGREREGDRKNNRTYSSYRTYRGDRTYCGESLAPLDSTAQYSTQSTPAI